VVVLVEVPAAPVVVVVEVSAAGFVEDEAADEPV
jgi:hypothetical protein